MQSMAKQFGSLGKKFRKNLSKITQTVGGGGSGYGKLTCRCARKKNANLILSGEIELIYLCNQVFIKR